MLVGYVFGQEEWRKEDEPAEPKISTFSEET